MSSQVEENLDIIKKNIQFIDNFESIDKTGPQLAPVILISIQEFLVVMAITFFVPPLLCLLNLLLCFVSARIEAIKL